MHDIHWQIFHILCKRKCIMFIVIELGYDLRYALGFHRSYGKLRNSYVHKAFNLKMLGLCKGQM